MSAGTKLPPGQYELDEFPRFGLTTFAERFPRETEKVELKIGGDVTETIAVSRELAELPRVNQTSDFHCVTTWSRRAQRWSGFLFADFYRRVVVPRARPLPQATFVILRCQDGYAVSLPLADLLADDVLFADTLNGEPLGIKHGAPIRLVAPAHYGYKSAKHVRGVDFWCDERHYRAPALRFMDHRRARVALEERGRGFPGWFLRYLYRPLVRPTIRRFGLALARHLNRTS